jgi:hypothetical protein
LPRARLRPDPGQGPATTRRTRPTQDLRVGERGPSGHPKCRDRGVVKSEAAETVRVDHSVLPGGDGPPIGERPPSGTARRSGSRWPTPGLLRTTQILLRHDPRFAVHPARLDQVVVRLPADPFADDRSHI